MQICELLQESKEKYRIERTVPKLWNKLKRVGFNIRFLDSMGSELTGNVDAVLSPITSDHSRLNVAATRAEDKAQHPEKYLKYELNIMCDRSLVSDETIASAVSSVMEKYSIGQLLITRELGPELTRLLIANRPEHYKVNQSQRATKSKPGVVAILYYPYDWI